MRTYGFFWICVLLFLPACFTHKDIRKKAVTAEKNPSALSSEKELPSAGGLSQRLSHIEAGIRELRGELESRDKAQKDRIDQIMQTLDLRDPGAFGGQKKPKKKSVSVKKPATFKKAEKFFKEENWKSAIVHYEKYRAQNKKGEFYGRATLQIGLCFQKLEMQKEAKVFFREVVSAFPKSTAAKEAKQKLKAVQKLSGDSSPAQKSPAKALPKKAKAGSLTKK